MVNAIDLFGQSDVFVPNDAKLQLSRFHAWTKPCVFEPLGWRVREIAIPIIGPGDNVAAVDSRLDVGEKAARLGRSNNDHGDSPCGIRLPMRASFGLDAERNEDITVSSWRNLV